jgi:uncharacterized protein DUF2530
VPGQTEPDAPKETQKSPPPLSPRLLALPPLVYVGTAAWAALFVVLAIARYGFDVGPPPIWMWTAMTGTILGLIGVPLMAWQRRASRRGARGAQRNL